MIKLICKIPLCVCLAGALFLSTRVNATSYRIPDNGSVLIGSSEQYTVERGDYFFSIAQFYDIGLLALIAANPGIDPFLPSPGTNLVIPTRMILPEVQRKGIVINLAELRLYYFTPNSNTVHVFPVGIGREGRHTPEMSSKISTKLYKPSWTPTKNSRKEYLEKYGEELPLVVEPGEDNPLGEHALRLSYGSGNYLIHGTNREFGIGMRISAGCIRMNPESIAWLYDKVRVNTPVRIINQPIKIAAEPNGNLLLEVHSPLSEKRFAPALTSEDIKARYKQRYIINESAVQRALLLHRGMPIKVNM